MRWIFGGKSSKIHVIEEFLSTRVQYRHFGWISAAQKLQTLKILFVYALLGAALAPDFWLLNFDFWELGISFKSNMSSTKQRELEQSKQHRKAATRIEILSRKSEKWVYSLTTVPVPYSEIPFTSGKSTNFSCIILSSWLEFCPKIDISVK